MLNYTLAFDNMPAHSQNPLIQRRAIVQLFNKAASRAKRRRFLARFTGHSTQLHALKTQNSQADGQVLGIQSVSLDEIVGSEGRYHDFDNQFWPLKERNRDRWVNIAQAIRNKKSLPPVQLIYTDNGYFVRDGHHRISVARALGQATIEAEVISCKNWIMVLRLEIRD
ncbi:MAG: hypothetical protein DHS20C20_02020 [Ardenticatenaceae bacterium]|nr:MAG: hypothetical protein DHS20C20_02020 [Ardenticatenaceae bacterium]